jgi:putative transposase
VVVDAKTVRGSIKIKYKNKKRVIKEMNKEGVKLGDAEIKQDELGRWFIIQPIMRNAQEHPVECIPNHEKPFAQVYIDPGVRTGITGYCPEGVAFKMGDELFELVRNKLIKADKCMSAADLLKNSGGKNQKIKRIRRRAQALRTKVQSVRRDVHRKICRFLCDNFDTIFLPKLDTISLSAVGGRNISSQTVRNTMTFAHGEFRVFLEAYAKVRGVTVVHPSEAFTTKTCTGCGFVREVGGVHTLHCERCRLTIDRDLSAARSLSLRCLATPSLAVT